MSMRLASEGRTRSHVRSCAMITAIGTVRVKLGTIYLTSALHRTTLDYVLSHGNNKRSFV